MTSDEAPPDPATPAQRVRAADVAIRTAAIEWHYLADQPGGEAKIAALHAAVEEWSTAMNAWSAELGGGEHEDPRT